MNKSRKILIILLFIGLFILYRSRELIGFASGEDEIKFTGYNKIGDTLKVINAPSGSTYEWRVYSIIDGKDIKTESNTTGQFKVTSDYVESFIYCYIREADTEIYMYVSNLPVMYINSSTQYTNVTKDEYSDITLKLVGNSKYTDSNFLYSGDGSLKVRGNSTATRDKKPFRLKLDKSTNLLNLGMEDDGTVYKSKHWVLLANDIDHTLMRNKLLYDFSGDIGFEYYFKSENVQLIYNGEFVGTYLLCEHRRVDEGRVDITDWVSLGEDIASAIAKKEWSNYGYASSTNMEEAINSVMYSDYSWIDNSFVMVDGNKFTFSNYGYKLPKTNGGYLAEIDLWTDGSSEVANIDSAYGIPIYINTPEVGEDSNDIVSAVNSFKTTSLYKNAKDLTQSFEYAVHSYNFVFNNGIHNQVTADGTYTAGSGWKSKLKTVSYSSNTYNGKHYSEIFDMDSLVNNFLFSEFTNNFDAMKTSAFYYKEVDKLAKMGPVWDLDMTLGNINMWANEMWYPAVWQTTNEHFTSSYSYQSYNWYRSLIKDPYFLVKSYERYKEIRPIIEELIKDGGLIDQYGSYLEDAGHANDARWRYTYTPQYYNGAQPLDFDDSIESMKKFIDMRMEWLDRQFKSVESLIKSLGYYKETSDLKYEFNGRYLKVTSSNILSNNIEVQVNGRNLIKANLVNGEAIVTIPKSYLNVNNDLNVVVIYEKNNNEYILNKSIKPSSNYEYGARSIYFYFKTNDSFIDKSMLSNEIKVLDEKNYTSESWVLIKEIYLNARNVLDNDKSMQTDIDKCLAELQNVKSNLVLKPNVEIEKPNEDIITSTKSDDVVTSSDDVSTPNDDKPVYIPSSSDDDNSFLDIFRPSKYPNKVIKKGISFVDIFFVISVIGTIGIVIYLILCKRKKTSV